MFKIKNGENNVFYTFIKFTVFQGQKPSQKCSENWFRIVACSQWYHEKKNHIDCKYGYI